MEYFQVENYKAFKEAARVDISPLTMLFGANNAGKSALARLLPSVSYSVLNKCEESDFLNFDFSGASFGSSNFFHNDATSCSIKLGLGEDISVSYSFYNDDNTAKITELVFYFNGVFFCRLERILPNENEFGKRLKISDYNSYVVTDGFESYLVGKKLNIDFCGICPMSWDYDWDDFKSEEAVLNILSLTRVYLIRLSKKIFWLSPLRFSPNIIEKIAVGNLSVGRFGENSIQILAKDDDVLNVVNLYFEKILKSKLKIADSSLGANKVVTLLVSALDSKSVGVPLLDCGTGFSQVLPILILGAQAMLGRLGDNPILIFESPELHLHDAIQDDLGDFFVNVIKSSASPKIIFETHSENLMLAIQLKIAEGKINSEDFILYSVDKKMSGSSFLNKILFESSGIPSENWDVMNFSTAHNINRRISKLYAANHLSNNAKK